MKKNSYRPRKITLFALKCILLLSILLEIILLTEIGLRSFAFRNYGDSYYLWPPFFTRVSTPLPDTFPGIEGEKHFTINSLGLRGDELNKSHTFRILALGGSTTECGMLDETETWPFLLQEQLKTSYGEGVWVGNAGRRGSTSRDHIWHMKYLISQIEDVDILFLMTGINDFMFHLYDRYSPQFNTAKDQASVQDLDHAFFVHPYVSQGIKGSAIWKVAKQVKVNFFGRKTIFETEGKTQLEWQKRRQETTPKKNNLPDLTDGILEYRNNLETIVSMAKERDIHVVLLTQPVLWKSDLTQAEDHLLWFGCVQNERYECFSAGALVQGMTIYNDVVRELCQKYQLTCIDLEKILPRNTSIFYDDVHFNKSGAEQVASAIYTTLEKDLKSK